MKIRYILTFALLSVLAFSSCKKEVQKVEAQEAPKELTSVKMETVSLNISGMSCEIGCAKTIQSKLSKKDGVAEAKVIFQDSLANVAFDANKTSPEELISFINGIAGGDLYTASEVATETKK